LGTVFASQFDSETPAAVAEKIGIYLRSTMRAPKIETILWERR
jgi:hypothetical protein